MLHPNVRQSKALCSLWFLLDFATVLVTYLLIMCEITIHLISK